jgi:hypothetical protein
MALKESLKLAKREVQHALLSGTKESLDKTVTDWLANGWEILEAKMTLFDRNNNIFEVFYILIRTPKED